MKKILFLLFVPLLLSANPMPDPEAAALLKKLAESSRNYHPRSGRTAIFSRAQLKYGLERSDYLHRWGDRPLMQDTSFKNKGYFKQDGGRYSNIGFINPLSYRTMSGTLKRFGIDGFAFFPITSGRRDLYNYCGTPGAEIKVLPEYTYSRVSSNNYKPPTADDLTSYLTLAEEALKSPQSYRINGKVVFTSYPVSRNDIEFWGALKKALIAKFGDKFIIMPWGTFDFFKKPSGKDNKYTVKDINAMRDSLRKWLRVVDGFYYNSPAIDNRRYQPEFDREVIIPILHSVMMEPEFKNKYLAWGTKVGHMNCQLLGYSLDCFGTDMLRGTVGSAALAKADIINLVEWDEENENTCFRPTINTSFSTLRIIRYFSELTKGKKPSMLPGDDASIPNLVLSYRRIMSAGELLEMELTNIPDGTAPCKEYTVKLSLVDAKGKVVKTFPERKLAADKLKSTLFTVQTETLLKYQSVAPVLEITGGGKSFRADAGFQPIELRTNWNWDYVWVKQPLRDMNPKIQMSLNIDSVRHDGLVELRAKVDSPVKMRSVELLDGNDVIYSYSDKADYRATKDKIAIAATFQANWKSPLKLTGDIKWLNAPTVSRRPAYGQHGSNIDWKYSEMPVIMRPRIEYAMLNRKDIDRAEIEVNFPGVVTGKLKVAELMKLGSYGFSGPHGFNLVFRCYSSQAGMPVPIEKKKVEFTVLARPASDKSVYYLQVVDQDYRVFRGAVKSIFRPSGKEKTIHVFSVGENKSTGVKVDEKMLMPIEYKFSPEHGSVFYTPAGNELLGVLGGYTPQATGVAAGESAYGNTMAVYISRRKAKDFASVTPKYVKEPDGRWSLQFNGSSFVSLPLGVVPPYAGYEIEMDVWPETLLKNQTLLSGDMTAFDLTMRNGIPTAHIYCNQLSGHGRPSIKATGPKLKAGQWNHIVVSFDQKNFFVEVNGVRGKVVPAAGYQRYPRAYSIGAHTRQGNFFKGRIAKLKITPK